MTCALTGKLAFDEADISGREGQEVFSERKGLNMFQNKVCCHVPVGTCTAMSRKAQ